MLFCYADNLTGAIVYILFIEKSFSFLIFITHGASEASGERNFWHLDVKILYTVEPKTATSPCVHFEVATSPTEKKKNSS